MCIHTTAHDSFGNHNRRAYTSAYAFTCAGVRLVDICGTELITCVLENCITSTAAVIENSLEEFGDELQMECGPHLALLEYCC